MKGLRIVLTALLFAPLGAEARAVSSNPDVAAYQTYRHEVDRLTGRTYREHRDEIDPGHLRGRARGYDLDHAFTVRCAYAWGLPAADVASVSNLRIVTASANRSDGARGCKGMIASFDP